MKRFVCIDLLPAILGNASTEKAKYRSIAIPINEIAKVEEIITSTPFDAKSRIFLKSGENFYCKDNVARVSTLLNE